MKIIENLDGEIDMKDTHMKEIITEIKQALKTQTTSGVLGELVIAFAAYQAVCTQDDKRKHINMLQFKDNIRAILRRN